MVIKIEICIVGREPLEIPTTLIQGGTKEMLLSDFVRLFQALDQADVPVKLDIYEGMPHAFQAFFHNTTESNIGISKTNGFLKEYWDIDQ